MNRLSTPLLPIPTTRMHLRAGNLWGSAIGLSHLMWLACAVLMCGPTLHASDAKGVSRSAPYESSKPHWEFGADAIALAVPAYPGSSVSPANNLLLPWWVIRSDRIQLDDSGLTVTALNSDRFSLDLSMDASFNVDSSDAPVRQGMPDIDYMFELGPELQYTVLERSTSAHQYIGLYWSSSVRLALSTDFEKAKTRGFVFGTDLYFYYEGLWRSTLDFTAGIDATWATEPLMDYLYEVEQQFATDSRMAYDAHGGYLGANLWVQLERPIGKSLLAYAGVTLNYNQGAKNHQSPLFESVRNTGAYLGLSWTISQSKRSVRTTQVYRK